MTIGNGADEGLLSTMALAATRTLHPWGPEGVQPGYAQRGSV